LFSSIYEGIWKDNGVKMKNIIQNTLQDLIFFSSRLGPKGLKGGF